MEVWFDLQNLEIDIRVCLIEGTHKTLDILKEERETDPRWL